MHAAANPYNPGSGLRPPALEGRDEDLERLTTLVQRTDAGLPGRGLVLTGLRGVGKTVLLNVMRDRAEAAGWFVVSVEARPDSAGATSVRHTLARNIAAQARRLRRPGMSSEVRAALASVGAFSVSVGTSGIDLGVELTTGRADSGDIEVDLPEMVQDLSAALAETRQAFGLVIDEMQDLDDDLLRALLVTQHQAGQRGWPFYIVGAGLPQLPTVLAEARSYAERLFDYREISSLDVTDSQRALTEPLHGQGGVAYTTGALDILVAASGGYPYFLQEYGSSTWEVASDPLIDDDTARAGVQLGLQRLDAGFFSSRWNRASRSERGLLVAMAVDRGKPSTTGDVAERMGLKPTSLGPYRARLIAKGLIYSPGHGLLAYTVPGMAQYVDRHREDL